MIKKTIAVFDNDGLYLSHCTYERARKLIKERKAFYIGISTIKLVTGKKQKLREKHMVIKEDRRVCYICTEHIPENKQATVDHVIPKSRDKFADIKMNMRCCCERCNNDKNDRTLYEYVKYMKRNRYKYPYISRKRLDYLEKYAKQHEKDYYSYINKKYYLDGGGCL